MSGNLFRFKFTDDSANLHEIIKNVTITALNVRIVYTSGHVLGRYQTPVSWLTKRRNSPFDVLRNDFLDCPYLDCDSFRVCLTAATGHLPPSVCSVERSKIQTLDTIV